MDLLIIYFFKFYVSFVRDEELTAFSCLFEGIGFMAIAEMIGCSIFDVLYLMVYTEVTGIL